MFSENFYITRARDKGLLGNTGLDRHIVTLRGKSGRVI
jgi:hypothetical protein